MSVAQRPDLHYIRYTEKIIHEFGLIIENGKLRNIIIKSEHPSNLSLDIITGIRALFDGRITVNYIDMTEFPPVASGYTILNLANLIVSDDTTLPVYYLWFQLA